jgi:hypothetical protein
MKLLKVLGAIILPVALFAGCKGSGSGAPETVADFCAQYADAVCQVTTTSCVSVPLASCTANQEAVCTSLANQAMADGLRKFAPANVGDCIGKVKAAFSSNNPITAATQATIDLACNYVFQGKGVQLTDTCISQFDCAGTTNGTIICDAAQKLCATAMTVAGTKQCSDVGDVCATNFYCTTATVPVCTAEGTSAAASDCTTAPCDSASRCAGGTCMPLVAAGGACAADSDCASGGYCDRFGTSPACVKGLSFANSSPSCLCVGQGMSCPAGLPQTWGVSVGTATGAGGTGGSGAGGVAGAAGASGTGGHGAAGSSGTGGAGGGAAGGAAGAASGAAGAAGAAGSGVAGSGALNDNG